MRSIKVIFLSLICLSSIYSCKNEKKEQWIPLFNAKDLSGWDIKISGYELNDNYKNTFIVENGVLKTNYEEYSKFNYEFGHIFYQTPYSHYKLRLEYRFLGKQCAEGPGWAERNSGVMIHSQSAASMGKGQSFPVSIEVQFLGGLGDGERPTGNLCTPGTLVDIDGKPYTDHCLNSSSKTYHGDVWVKAELVVLGDSIIHHIIEGDTVLTYTNTRIGGGYIQKMSGSREVDLADSLEYVQNEGKALKMGYISLQAESHPIEFRKIELLNLEAK